ncbi:hypothetical protein SDC9_109688 [bioreactor metagenome]|uniref:NTP pyrophosphohydrolase MazG putative catalytic core domain-containing protein n=1 Tax=bioreactor metagenome TaxID=1076179 RepID=A0A645BBI3_9ZZZZ
MKNPMTISEFQSVIRTFCDERDWQQFHNPKDLAIGISTEANELLELFRFKNQTETTQLMSDKAEAVANELSDVFFYVLRFADLYQIDLTEAFLHKMDINARHYPAAKVKGSNKKYNEL